MDLKYMLLDQVFRFLSTAPTYPMQSFVPYICGKSALGSRNYSQLRREKKELLVIDFEQL